MPADIGCAVGSLQGSAVTDELTDGLSLTQAPISRPNISLHIPLIHQPEISFYFMMKLCSVQFEG
jgi:hypothetical protein